MFKIFKFQNSYNEFVSKIDFFYLELVCYLVFVIWYFI